MESRAKHAMGSVLRTPIRSNHAVLRSLLLFCFVAFWLLLSGCSRCRLPAIDPSGNRILSGGLTQLNLPRIHASTENIGIIPTPGFREPPPPPACLDAPTAAAPSSKTVGHRTHGKNQLDDRGRCGQLLLTPTRIVAPVNGDVVLMSGICGEDGFLVAGEAIEWMISPESVGQIIAVGDDGSTPTGGLFRKAAENPVKKLDVDFARGLTAWDENIVTRGSAKLSDDLRIKKGQTWISLTSPTEGTTRVTALAPDAEVWDQRRQTATIYWVDARWLFPSDAQTVGLSPVQLLTRVTRAEGFAPAEGWIVRYRSQDPNIAAFAGNSPVIEARVDANGVAAVPINNVSGRPGSALVTIEVVRPAIASENMPQLTLGTGQTVVSWTAPELVLQVNGPANASVNQALTYTASLANLGTMPAGNTRLSMPIPTGMTVVSASQTPSQQSNAALAWDIGELPSQQQFILDVVLQPTAESDYRVQFDATSATGAIQSQAVATLVTSPRVSLRFTPAQGSEQVEVGSLVQTELVIVNNGRTALNNIAVTVESEPGLQSIQGEANLVRRVVSYLAPGETQVLNPAFNARQIGTLKATAIASINDVELARQTTSIQVIAAAVREPRISLQFQTASGTDEIQRGARKLVKVVVANTGQVPLRNIQATLAYSSSLNPTSASEGFNLQESMRQLSWTLPSLEVGQDSVIQAEFDFDGMEAAPQIVANVESAPQVRANAVLKLRPVGGGSVLPPNNTLPPSNTLPESNTLPPGNTLPNNSANPSGLTLSLIPVQATARTNSEGRYVLTIVNNQNSADQNVQINIQIQPGLEIASITTSDGRNVVVNYATDKSSAAFETIRYIGSNETIQYYVNVLHRVPGTWSMRATAISTLKPNGIEAISTAQVSN